MKHVEAARKRPRIPKSLQHLNHLRDLDPESCALSDTMRGALDQASQGVLEHEASLVAAARTGPPSVSVDDFGMAVPDPERFRAYAAWWASHTQSHEYTKMLPQRTRLPSWSMREQLVGA